MCGCEGAYHAHAPVSPDPRALRIENRQVSSAAGRAPITGVESRAAGATQTQEVPWFFAATIRPERIQAEDNNGATAKAPRVHQTTQLRMAPWLETHPTVVRIRPNSDDGLGGGSCR